jgi:hypothetical protein
VTPPITEGPQPPTPFLLSSYKMLQTYVAVVLFLLFPTTRSAEGGGQRQRTAAEIRGVGCRRLTMSKDSEESAGARGMEEKSTEKRLEDKKEGEEPLQQQLQGQQEEPHQFREQQVLQREATVIAREEELRQREATVIAREETARQALQQALEAEVIARQALQHGTEELQLRKQAVDKLEVTIEEQKQASEELVVAREGLHQAREEELLERGVNVSAREVTLHNREVKLNPSWDCALQLSRALAGNTTVKILRLDGCNFDDAGVAELVDALKINKTLEEISLRKVGIKQDKALAMVGALLSNNVLKKLDLSANDLGEFAVAALANGLEINDTLVSIALSGTTKGNDCALHLAAALRINHKVSHLDLSYCGVERTGILALALAIQATAAQRAEIFHLGRITTGARPTYSDGSQSIHLRRVAVKLGFPVQSWGWSNRRITTEMLTFGKMFAFVMGTHTRLGGDNQSLVFALNKDLCVMILKAWEWPQNQPHAGARPRCFVWQR